MLTLWYRVTPGYVVIAKFMVMKWLKDISICATIRKIIHFVTNIRGLRTIYLL